MPVAPLPAGAIRDPLLRAVAMATLLGGSALLFLSAFLSRLERLARRARARRGEPPLPLEKDRQRRVMRGALVAGLALLAAGFVVGKLAPRVPPSPPAPAEAPVELRQPPR